MGQRLVERAPGGRRVALTLAGELLLEHSAQILAHAEAARADLGALAEGRLGTLRLGVFPSIAARLGATLVQELRRVLPQIELSLVEGPSDTWLLQRLERGELDLAFAVLPLPEGPFEAIDVHEDEYVLLVGADTQLARTGGAAALDDMRDLPLVRHVGTAAGEDHLRRHGVEPRFVYVSQINSTTLGLVAEGAGAAFVPRLVMDPGDARVRSLELAAPLRISRRIAIVRHRHRRNVPGADELVAVARRAFESV